MGSEAGRPLLEVEAGGQRWRFDREFLTSTWRCIWDAGCQGILDTPAAHLGQGCCSVGAEMLDDDEARLIAALAACLDPARFEHHREAADGDIFADATRSATRIVDSACIFLNRPGFGGGPGCALHLAALDAGESPIDWKPSVCWQLPIKVDRSDGSVTVRAWGRQDWGAGGRTMAWCCTEEPEAFGGPQRVIDSLAPELEAVVGSEVFVELRARLADEKR